MKASDPAFERSVCDHLEGTLPESERLAFEQRLRNDPAALDILCSQALLSAHLQRIARSTADASVPGRRSHRVRALVVPVAAAALLVVSFTVWMQWKPESGGGTGNQVRIEVSPHTIYEVRGSDGRMGNPGIGSTVVLNQGVIDLTLPSGSRALVSAPAELTIEGPNTLRMLSGRGRFDVPEGAEGFVVNTADMKIIDHGTKFTVDTFDPAGNRAEVVEGKIEVHAIGGRRESSMLVAGQATGAGADGTLRPVAGEPYRFLKSLPSGLPSLRFSLDLERGGRLTAEGSLAQTARVEVMMPPQPSSQPGIVPGRFGSALRFTDNHRFVRTTWPGIEGTMARSISFWLRMDPGKEPDAYVPLLGWGMPNGPRTMSQFSLLLSGEPGKNNLRIASGRRWLQGATRLDDGVWHHVVVILEKYISGQWPVTRTYVDGRSESLTEHTPEDGDAAPLTSFKTITNDPRSVPLTFGRLGEWKEYPSQPWELDEVVVAAGVLTDSQIQALSEGRPEDSGLSLVKNPK